MLDTCPTCLALLKPGHKECPVCGTAIPASTPNAPAPHPSPRPTTPTQPPTQPPTRPAETLPDDMLATAPLAETWAWARAHWSLAAVPRRRQAVAGGFS